MFGGLKKRLKEAVEKVSGVISKEQPEDMFVGEVVEGPRHPVPHHEPAPPIKVKEAPEEKFAEVKEPTKEELGKMQQAEIKKEAELIAEDEGISEIIKKSVREEERKEFAEEVQEVLEEAAEEKDLLEIKEEAKLITESETFAEVIAESTKEHEKETRGEVEKIIEQIEAEDVKDSRKFDAAEKKLEEIEKEMDEGPKPEPKLSFMQKIKGKTLGEEEFNEISNEISIALLENDVSVEVKDRIVEQLRKELVGSFVPRGKAEETIMTAIKHAVKDVMHQEKVDLNALIDRKEGPFTIMVVGFNGTGKTTTLAKLAYKLRAYNPVLAAGDTFRAASIEQLEEHGRKLDMRVVKQNYGADSAAVIFDARKYAEATGNKLVLADTAGRAHNNANLMDELKKIARVNQPDMKILVLDSITGNDIYEQCRLFNDAVGVDAIILTKADVYERGGAALSAVYTLKKPILFLGVGQLYDDLKEFNPEEIAEKLFE